METNDLPFGDGPLELSIRIIDCGIFQKIFDFFSFFSNLHHT